MSIAPVNRNDGPPPYSDGGIVSKPPKTPDFVVIKDETPTTPDIEALEEKFWEYLSNNEEFQKLAEQCKAGSLGAYTVLEKKVAELKEQFMSENSEIAQAQENKDSGFNPFKFGAISQGGLIGLIA